MRLKYFNFLLISSVTASTFLFYNNFSSYRENPASDLLLEYDRLQDEIANKKFSPNGLKYLNRVKLEISNRIAYRLKIRDCTEFFNEHSKAENGKYILYPDPTKSSGTIFSCEKNMETITERKLVDLRDSNVSAERENASVVPSSPKEDKRGGRSDKRRPSRRR